MPDPDAQRLHLLVRNERENLPDAIASVRGVADEIVVTDTGSTDGTPELAAKLGARVEHFPWCDDFAAGWNHGLTACRSDWVLILDADERLLPHPHHHHPPHPPHADAERRSGSEASGLRPAIRRLDEQNLDAAAVLRRDLTDLDDTTRFTKMAQLRLFRRSAFEGGLRFVGRCHPAPASLDRPPPLLREVELLHHGYIAALRPAKLQRAARLLVLELADRPDGPRNLYYRIELLRTRLILGDPAAGEALTRAAAGLAGHVDDPDPPLPHAALLLETLLQWPADRLPPPFADKPERVRALAERWFPDAPPLLWLLAGRDFQAGRFDAAARRLDRLVAMGRDHSYPAYTGFDPAIVGEQAAINLAACRIKLGQLDAARRLLEPLADHPRVGGQARANLATIMELGTSR